MHHSRLVWTALALWAVAGTTTLALACDKAKDAQASAASVSTCKAHNASASMDCCAMKGAKATAASAALRAESAAGATAVTASVKGGMNAECSAEMAAKCTAEMAAACKAHGASAEMAAACKAHDASAAMDHCAMMKGANVTSANAARAGTVTAVAAGATCGAKGMKTSAAGGKSGACTGEGMASMADRGAHADCDACGDMIKCADEISAAGGRSQMVPLKNGVMFVYTAESAAGIRAIKTAIAQRNERMAVYTSAGEKVHLCPECKTMRGAAASGKLTREVVSIEGGCLTLMTSNDPAVVAQLHSMVGTTAARVKS